MLATALLGGVSALALTVGEARAACSPTASGPTPPPGTTVTCSGVTLNQNAPNGYGTSSGVPPNANNLNDQSGLTLNVDPGASVTGTNSGIVLAAGNIVNVGAGASVIGGFIALNLRANFGESNTVDNAGTLNGGTGAGVAALGGQIIEGGDLTLTNTGTIIGGTGGTGLIASGVVMSSGTVINFGSILSNGTANSAGVFVVDGQGDATVINSGTITGLTGIAFNNFGFNATVLNSGTITGTGGTAISFIDAGVLTLHSTSVINGNVVSGFPGSLLQLGGTSNGSFNVANIGSQYQGFTSFEKIDSSTWTLTGGVATEAATPWTIFAGTLEASHANAGIVDSLGNPSNSPVTLAGGTLVITVPSASTLANDVQFQAGASTLAAATGSTVTATGMFTLADDSVAKFGSSDNTGTIVSAPSVATSVGTNVNVVVAGGTLKAGNSDLGMTLGGFGFTSGTPVSTTVITGATLDFDAYFASIHNLKGGGNVSFGANGMFGPGQNGMLLWVDKNSSSTFSGVISGPGAVEIGTTDFNTGGTMIFTGANTYTGPTYICFCTTVQLGDGGSSGSVVGDVFNGGTLAFNRMDTYTFAGNISDFGSDAGNVKQIGPGTTVLTGNNTYSGGTYLLAGKLSVGSNNNLGAPTGALNFDGGTLQVTGTTFNSTSRPINWGAGGGGFDIADAANSFTVGPLVGAGGALTKFGPGTLVLTGANTYAGGTTVAGGTLSISADANLGTGPLAMFNGTTLQLTGSFNFTHPTSVAGDPTVNVTTGNTVTMSAPITDGAASGDLVKTGAGALILAANNTYTGGTTVSGGTLQLGNGGTSGSIVGNVVDNANFAINHSDTFTFGGLISGTGAFQQNGTGTTVFTANNTYAGGTTINAGTLQLGNGGTSGAIAGNVVDNANLAFNRSNTYAFDGVISGTGAVQQNGTGTTIFSATHSYTGATTVNAGTLLVNGSIASSSGLTVNAGGVVGGSGTLPKTTINGGALSPGNSIGTISISGSLSFVGAGNYIVEVSPAAADKTNVSGVPGTATLAGTLNAIGTGGSYTAGTKYTVLNATGGVSGTFSSLAISGNFGGTKPHVEYDANNVYLVLDPNALSLTGLTFNQRSVATAINTALQSGNQSAPFAALFGLTAAQLPGALDQLSGEVHPSTASVLLDESLYARSAILGRLRQASYGGDTQTASLASGGPLAYSNGEELTALAYAKSPIVTKAPPLVSQPGYDVVFWAQGFGAWGKFDGDGNAATVRRDLAGFFTGVDTRVGTNGRLGIAAGYTGSKNALDNRGSATVETGHLAGYGGWSVGNFNLRAGGAYAWHTIDTTRTAVFPGFFDTDTAHYNGSTGQIFGEAGYGFAFGKVAVEPFAGAAWVRLKTDGFNERGGLAALNVGANSFDVGYSTLGIRAATVVPLAYDMLLVPRASLAWQHAFDDVTPADTLAFQAAGVPFVIAGVPIARDALLAEAGLDLALSRNVTVGISYVGQIADNVRDHAAKGKFSWKF